MSTRIWLTVGIAIAAATASSQDFGKPITFSAPASRAAVLLPELAKSVGFELKTTAQTEDEVLLIQVKDVSIRDLMDRIAKAANAEWRKEGKGYRLIRPTTLSRKAAAKEAAQRTQLFKEFLALESADVKAVPAWSQAQAQALAKSVTTLLADPDRQMTAPREYQDAERSIQKLSPITGAICALLNQIGASDLAAVEPSQRAVFALHPTAMQIQLNGQCRQIFEQYAANQRQYAEEVAKLEPAAGPQRARRRMADLPTLAPGNPALGIGQALLILSQSMGRVFGRGVGIQATIIVADTNGATLASGSTMLFRQVPDPSIHFSNDRENPISFGPLAKEMNAAIQSQAFGPGMDEMPRVMSQIPGVDGTVAFTSKISFGAPRKPLSADLRSKMLHPDLFDPLSIVVGEELTSASANLHFNLVADLPDSCAQHLESLAQGFNASVGAAALFNYHCPESGLDVQQSNGWVVISPSEPNAAEYQRVNRVALAKLIRALDEKGAVSIDDIATFALSQEKPVVPYDVDGKFLQTVCGSAGKKAVTALRQPDVLRIYGTLNSGQRAAMLASASISIDHMTVDQKKWLADDIFNSNDGPRLLENEASGPTPRGFDPNSTPSVLDERTQILPNGIRTNGQLQFKTSVEQGLCGHEQASGLSGYVNCADIAARMYQKDRPELGTPIYYDTFRPATRQKVSFMFRLEPSVVLARNIESTSIDMNASEVSFDNLPTDTKKKVLEILDLIRKSPFASMTFNRQGGGRFSPPPP